MSETFTITRTEQRGKATLGMMTDENGAALCWTLEDLQRAEKMGGETAIPVGRYELIAQSESKFMGVYQTKMEGWGISHPFMIELADVPDFRYILIHCGRTHGNTKGCILVGDSNCVNYKGHAEVRGSWQAYKRIYPLLRDAVNGGGGWIQIVNEVRGEEGLTPPDDSHPPIFGTPDRKNPN